MATLHGRGGMVYLSSGGVAIAIANARSWKFTIDRALDENNKFGDTWVTQLLGFNKWTGSIDGNFDTADVVPWGAVTGTAIMNMYFYPDRTTVTNYYYGFVWPKLDVTVTLDAVIRYTMDFDGDGQLTSKP